MPTDPMTPADLERAARLLFGEHSRGWQRPLARALQHPRRSEPGIDDRLVRRWIADEAPVPDWVPGALLDLAEQRRAEQPALPMEQP